RLDRLGLADALAGRHRKGRLQREWPDEHRQSTQRRAFAGRQQVIAPAERRTQRLVPRDGGTPPAPQQRETTVEQRGRAGYSVGIDPSGGKLDRKCDAVEPPAYLGNERGLFLAQLELTQAFGNSFDEELARGIGKNVGDAEPVALWRTFERKQAKDSLAL